MKYVLLLTCTLLTACADPAQQAAWRQQIEQADHQECLRLGYKAGTPAYGDCRLRLREMRIEERAINRSPVYYPNIGMHYGYHHHDW